MPRWQNTIHRCMSKKNRQRNVPGAAISRPSEKKGVIIQEHESRNSKKPSWRFGRFDASCEAWGMNTLRNNLIQVIDGLKSYEDLTWQQIVSAPHDKKGKSKNHTVGIEGLTNAAKKRLSRINEDDVPSIFSLRLNNLFRIIGILQDEIMYILWIDPNHEVCATKR